MIAAFTFHRDRLHMGCDSLPDLRGKRRHKRADSKWPSAVDNIGQIQQTDRHVFGIVTGGRKITNDFFSIFHLLVPWKIGDWGLVTSHFVPLIPNP